MALQFDTDYIPHWSKYGRKADLWITHLDVLKKFVKEHKLRAIPESTFPEVYQPAMALMRDVPKTSKRAVAIKWPRPFPGGLRGPHIHIGDRIFVLNTSQWKDFSGRIMDEFTKRLTKVNRVSFEQMLDVTETVGGLY